MRVKTVTSQLPTLLALCVLMFAATMAFGGRYLVTSEKSITEGCEASFCVGQDQASVDAVLQASDDRIDQTLKSKPFDVLQISAETIKNNEVLGYDRFDYWHVILKKDRGWEKHVRLKFKNDVLIEIDIKSYGPLAIS
ncbi:MAG: hypothetical protein EX271_08730 [Acidimicrobiales bacterium]|nr:hypothetical protein [Hyphomonadaceae bacterium]RZV41093.1 MAG: hypothetical protein EX271_08730 [Acidimicrobiales bacterium]